MHVRTVRFSLLLTLIFASGMTAHGQIITAQSPKITVNFSENSKSKIQILDPIELANPDKLFMISDDKIKITGIATDKEGIKEVLLNDSTVVIDAQGRFSYLTPLDLGSNELSIKVIDIADEETTVMLKVVSQVGDYVYNPEAEIQIIKPAQLAKTRGFLTVTQEKIIIEGVARDPDGIKELYLDGNVIYFDHTGHFISSATLENGPNLLSFKVVDQKNEITIKEFYLNKEESQELLSSTGEYYALLIANENYNDPSIIDLDYPISDISALKEILSTKYAFKDDNILVLNDPTREEIIDKLDFLSATVTAEDNALIFYAGHGLWDAKSEIGYWLPKNAKKTSKAAWFRNSTLRDYIKEIPSKHTLLIADACFSGSIFKSRKAFPDATIAINKMHELSSRKAMTSGTLKEVPDKSAFMKYFLKRLQENQERYLPAYKMFISFRTAVMNNSPNVPQYGTVENSGDEGGDFIFVLK